MIEESSASNSNFYRSMALQSAQPALIGFVSQEFGGEESELKAMLREELETLRDLFGYRLTMLASIRTRSDLTFLQACIQLRIPFILILPEDHQQLSKSFGKTHWSMATHLMSVSLARYAVPKETAPAGLPALILEWADGFVCVRGAPSEAHFHDTHEALEDAAALGTPSRVIHASSSDTTWQIPPDPQRAARHGFETRKDLLEFFDARLGSPVVS